MAQYTKRLNPQTENRIERIEQIVQLAKERRAIYVVHWNRVMPAASLMNQTANVLQKFIEWRLLYVYNTKDKNDWVSPTKIDYHV